MVRPLGDSLVSDADGISCGMRGASEQINGFGFEHSQLNHSSGSNATIVPHKLPSSATMVSYKERLAAAIKAAQVSDNQLAAYLGVSIQAVRKISAGTSLAFSAENNAKAARFLRVSSYWLATGDGEMRSDRTWPFVLLTQKQAASLTKVNLETVENLALDLLARQQSLSPSVVSYSNNEPPAQVQPATGKPIPVKRVAFKIPEKEEQRERTGGESKGATRRQRGG